MRVHRARHASCLLVLAIVIAMVLAVPVATAGTGEFTYPERLEILKSLARRYDAGAIPGTPLGRYGLWAGILAQTRWQLDSGRDTDELWSLVNFGLSVETTAYADELAAAQKGARDPQSLCRSSEFVRTNPTPAAALGPRSVDRATVCEGWMALFVAERAGRPAADIQRLMWAALTTSIVHSLRVYGGAFTRPGVSTDLEQNFWGSWIELGFVLAAQNYATDGANAQRISQLLMPKCAPIGGDGCAPTPVDLGTSYGFVSALASRPVSIERIFTSYETSRSNPAALSPDVLAFTDAPLAQAATLFFTL
jgi:hypothetical protein